MAIVTSSRVSPIEPHPRGAAAGDRPDRPDRLRSAAWVAAASAALLGGLIAAAYLVQDLLERGLLFMAA